MGTLRCPPPTWVTGTLGYPDVLWLTMCQAHYDVLLILGCLCDRLYAEPVLWSSLLFFFSFFKLCVSFACMWTWICDYTFMCACAWMWIPKVDFGITSHRFTLSIEASYVYENQSLRTWVSLSAQLALQISHLCPASLNSVMCTARGEGWAQDCRGPFVPDGTELA